jgi:hypothetical protein
MPEPRSGPVAALPRWVVLAASAVLVFHLFTIFVLVVAAPSGQWPTAFGPSMATPPAFAQALSDVTTRYYLMPLKMTHNYHFAANRTGNVAAYVEVRLKDADGKLLDTVKFPDDQANPWVRHRQSLLAQGLTDDLPVQPPQGEYIPPPGQEVPKVLLWDGGSTPGSTLHLEEKSILLIPRDRPVARPSPWMLVLARSYGRYLRRTHGAASAEMVRVSRESTMPMLMFEERLPANFDTLVSDFGEVSR